MALTRWAPFQGLFDMQRDMDLLMRRFMGAGEGQRQRWVPAVDVFHREGDLVVRAELPGVDVENDVEITLRDNLLTIKGERRLEQTNGNGNGQVARFESIYGSFERSVLLPDGVGEDDIQATYENGILEVVVPGVAELTAPKRIPIHAGGQKAITTTGEKAS